jgi:hypothetical protein
MMGGPALGVDAELDEGVAGGGGLPNAEAAAAPAAEGVALALFAGVAAVGVRAADSPELEAVGDVAVAALPLILTVLAVVPGPGPEALFVGVASGTAFCTVLPATTFCPPLRRDEVWGIGKWSSRICVGSGSVVCVNVCGCSSSLLCAERWPPVAVVVGLDLPLPVLVLAADADAAAPDADADEGVCSA